MARTDRLAKGARRSMARPVGGGHLRCDLSPRLLWFHADGWRDHRNGHFARFSPASFGSNRVSAKRLSPFAALAGGRHGRNYRHGPAQHVGAWRCSYRIRREFNPRRLSGRTDRRLYLCALFLMRAPVDAARHIVDNRHGRNLRHRWSFADAGSDCHRRTVPRLVEQCGCRPIHGFRAHVPRLCLLRLRVEPR